MGKPDSEKKAIEIFKEVAKNKEDEFWSKLAQEALATKGIESNQNQGG